MYACITSVDPKYTKIVLLVIYVEKSHKRFKNSRGANRCIHIITVCLGATKMFGQNNSNLNIFTITHQINSYSQLVRPLVLLNDSLPVQ